MENLNRGTPHPPMKNVSVWRQSSCPISSLKKDLRSSAWRDVNCELPRGTEDLPKHCAKRLDQTSAWLPPELDHNPKSNPNPQAIFAQENTKLPNCKKVHCPNPPC